MLWPRKFDSGSLGSTSTGDDIRNPLLAATSNKPCVACGTKKVQAIATPETRRYQHIAEIISTMANYDSDSSEGELDVRTNVTLGYATDDPTGDEISHVGGHPTWLDPNTKPSASLARCKICNSNMSLLLQLQADLQQQFPDDERRLHIWCCRKKQCSKKPGSVRSFREVKKARVAKKTPKPVLQTQEKTQPVQNLGNQLFGGSSTQNSGINFNPFSTSSTPQTNGNPFSELAAKPPQTPANLSQPTQSSSQPLAQSFADKLKISSSESETTQPPAEPWPAESNFPTPFPSFYLDAESEYLEPNDEPTSGPSNSQPRIEDAEDASSSSAAEKDLYESPHDKTFDHFTRVLSQNSEQVLRYEFRGVPLLYSSTDAVATHFVMPGHHLHSKVKTSGPAKGIPSCQYCGSARVFEMQLVPCLIYELEKDNEEAMKLDGGEGMEWGTIIVGTCGKNCGDERDGKVEFREEWVGVQWEEGGTELKVKK